MVCPPGPLFVLAYWVSIAVGGDTPESKPQAEAGSWAVLAAERALVLPTLQRG